MNIEETADLNFSMHIDSENPLFEGKLETGKKVSWQKKNESNKNIPLIFKRIITLLSNTLLETFLFLLRCFKKQKPKTTPSKKLVSGSQGACVGFIQRENVEKVFNRIQDRQPIGIRFNRENIQEKFSGGNCSAMSLDFAREYLKPPTHFTTLVERVTNLAQKYNLVPGQETPLAQEFRNQQAAFNCIEVNRSEKNVDFSLAKIQALANFHFLKIAHASKEFTYDENNLQGIRNSLSNEIEHLSNGVHLMRIILPEDNEKLENCGHSMVFIKEEKELFFYDPSYGTELIRGDCVSRVIGILKQYIDWFGLNQARFYTLENRL